MNPFIKRLIASAALLSAVANVALADCDDYLPSPSLSWAEGNCYSNCGPCTGWCDHFSLYGSWLYWKINGDEFDYAVVKKRQNSFDDLEPPAVSLSRDHQTIHSLKFDWDSGFRIGAGTQFPCLGWGLDIVWTHFDSSSSKSKNVMGTPGTPVDSGLQTLVSLPAVYNFGTVLTTGQEAEFNARYKFRLNFLDLEFSKWCCCNSCVTFRPHVGIRIADIHEGFRDRIAFQGITGEDPAQELFSETFAIDGRFFSKNRFKGAGLRAGLDLDLCLCEGWSIIGRGAASIIWGRTHLNQHFKYSTAGAADFYVGETSDNYRNSRIITDLLFGIRYETIACCWPAFIELAWEHHYLFSQHRFWVDNSFFSAEPSSLTPTLSSWKKNGSVSLQGLTLTAGIDF